MKKLLFFLLACLACVAAGCAPSYQPGHLSETAPPSQEGVERNYWKMDDHVFLYYFSHGSGTPVLIVHGGPGFPFTSQWRALDRLGKDFQFYYYHQRGCGNSTRPFERFDAGSPREHWKNLLSTLGMSAQLADIERIRQLLGQKQIILIGHSYGAFLASLYAAEFPGRVKKLVLVSPADVYHLPNRNGTVQKIDTLLPEPVKKTYRDFLRRYFDYRRLFRKNELELAALNTEFSIYYMQALSRKGAEIPTEDEIEPAEAGGWMVPALYLSLGRRYDYRALMQTVPCPVLVIYGNKDVPTAAESRAVASLFPKGEWAEIPEAGHFAFDETPEAFARIVEPFLQGTGAKP